MKASLALLVVTVFVAVGGLPQPNLGIPRPHPKATVIRTKEHSDSAHKSGGSQAASSQYTRQHPDGTFVHLSDAAKSAQDKAGSSSLDKETELIKRRDGSSYYRGTEAKKAADTEGNSAAKENRYIIRRPDGSYIDQSKKSNSANRKDGSSSSDKKQIKKRGADGSVFTSTDESSKAAKKVGKSAAKDYRLQRLNSDGSRNIVSEKGNSASQDAGSSSNIRHQADHRGADGSRSKVLSEKNRASTASGKSAAKDNSYTNINKNGGWNSGRDVAQSAEKKGASSYIHKDLSDVKNADGSSKRTTFDGAHLASSSGKSAASDQKHTNVNPDGTWNTWRKIGQSASKDDASSDDHVRTSSERKTDGSKIDKYSRDQQAAAKKGSSAASDYSSTRVGKHGEYQTVANKASSASQDAGSSSHHKQQENYQGADGSRSKVLSERNRASTASGKSAAKDNSYTNINKNGGWNSGRDVAQSAEQKGASSYIHKDLSDVKNADGSSKRTTFDGAHLASSSGKSAASDQKHTNVNPDGTWNTWRKIGQSASKDDASSDDHVRTSSERKTDGSKIDKYSRDQQAAFKKGNSAASDYSSTRVGKHGEYQTVANKASSASQDAGSSSHHKQQENYQGADGSRSKVLSEKNRASTASGKSAAKDNSYTNINKNGGWNSGRDVAQSAEQKGASSYIHKDLSDVKNADGSSKRTTFDGAHLASSSGKSAASDQKHTNVNPDGTWNTWRKIGQSASKDDASSDDHVRTSSERKTDGSKIDKYSRDQQAAFKKGNSAASDYSSTRVGKHGEYQTVANKASSASQDAGSSSHHKQQENYQGADGSRSKVLSERNRASTASGKSAAKDNSYTNINKNGGWNSGRDVAQSAEQKGASSYIHKDLSDVKNADGSSKRTTFDGAHLASSSGKSAASDQKHTNVNPDGTWNTWRKIGQSASKDDASSDDHVRTSSERKTDGSKIDKYSRDQQAAFKKGNSAASDYSSTRVGKHGEYQTVANKASSASQDAGSSSHHKQQENYQGADGSRSKVLSERNRASTASGKSAAKDNSYTNINKNGGWNSGRDVAQSAEQKGASSYIHKDLSDVKNADGSSKRTTFDGAHLASSSGKSAASDQSHTNVNPDGTWSTTRNIGQSASKDSASSDDHVRTSSERNTDGSKIDKYSRDQRAATEQGRSASSDNSFTKVGKHGEYETGRTIANSASSSASSSSKSSEVIVSDSDDCD